uniref:CDI toxin immunity protein n=1 Tax=Sutcliffiella sp. FSL R7-0096 TaxID=2921670 RepID=UPI0033838625
MFHYVQNELYWIYKSLSNGLYCIFRVLFRGIYNYPIVKTTIFTILDCIEDVIGMGLDQWIYCPSLRYVVEICHDDEVSISWI